MVTGELKNKVDGIWDIFWTNGVTNPLTAIEQITYLMFVKILDDNELKKESMAARLDTKVVNPIFDENHQNCRWSIFRNYELAKIRLSQNTSKTQRFNWAMRAL